MGESEKDWGFGDEKMRQQSTGGGSTHRPRNFWLKPNTREKFVFLDSRPYYTDEKERNSDDDVRVAYLTVARLWTGRDGKDHFSKDLFRMKRRTEEYFHEQVKKRDGLRGCEYEAFRQDDKSAAVGSQFDFEGKLTDKEIVARFSPYLGFLKKQTSDEYLRGYDYAKVLALPEKEWGSGKADDGHKETHTAEKKEDGGSGDDDGWNTDWRGGPPEDEGEPPPF